MELGLEDAADVRRVAFVGICNRRASASYLLWISELP